MEDSTQRRSSAIPRLSKLPLPRPTSGIPKPASALPRPASVIRPSPSKESLGGGELRNPRLRPSMSRDQLRTGQPDLQQRAQRLRPAVSRDNLNLSAGTRRTSALISKPTQLSPAKPFAQRIPSTPHRSIERQADIIEEQSTTPPYDPPGEAIGVQFDGNIFPRQLTLTRRPSESFAVSPLYDPANNIFDPNYSARPQTASTDDDDRSDTLGARSLKPRPSLSERTAETLANIPSSPALRKTSNFYDQGSRVVSSPRSRAGSGASRPGSSYASDGSTRQSSKAGSRPGSSSGQSDLGFNNFRASASVQRKQLTPIEGTPRKRSSTVVRTTPGKLPGMPPPFAEARSPSPGKTTIPTPKSGSKSMALRPAKTRAPVQGLFKKPSLPALNKASLHGASDRRVSVNSASTGSWDGTIPSSASSHNTSMTGDSVEPGTPPSARKSSAALREQIAKAKAAKRAQMKQVAENEVEHADGETPIVPQDTGFDFGMSQDDPFNLRRGEDPKKKVLQNRVSTARTTGRLNIAALHLKEIPVEVLKMYDLESIGDGSWAESVDLTRFVAADNEFEELDDFVFPDTNPASFDEEQASQGNIFAGLETLDMHGNLLINVPLGLRRLTCLTSLNLSSNRLTNNCLDTIAQVTSLRDLKLGNNLFYGPLNPILASLNELEILDVHGNNISALPHKIENMSRLRILNLSENSFESLPFDSLATLPITELNIRKNKLKGTLIEEPIGCLPQLHTLDASANQLERLVPLGSAIDLPVLHSLSLSMNRLQGLPDMTTWSNLLTLSVEENSISGIPNSFMGLDRLRHADFSSNDIRVIPPEVSRMDNLSMIRLSGNPLRDKKFLSITTEELKIVLSGRLEPPPPYQEPDSQDGLVDVLGDAKVGGSSAGTARSEDEDYRSDDNFATPPQSPNRSRSHTVSSRRSRSHTLSNQSWPVKPGGILDRSQTESSSLHPVVCSKVAAEHRVRQIFLQNNLFATLPNSLSFFAETLTALSLSHNQLVGEAYLTEELDLPALRELNLASNHITGLKALTEFLHAPSLEKIDVTMNRLNSLPAGLKEAFPSLNVLLAGNNHIVDLEPEMIKGLKIVDLSNNDIAHLNPRIGLLGGLGGLERFEVAGNRFRVPRWNVIERGTDATLRWLRGRVPVAEMASWQGDNDEPDVD
ncbi:related to receptor-like protein kinase 5 precursor [Fusarium torulosum]|uniref:Related to receptor-like protein kinase 5 n=1 Tax=Fusarium torulosum TaxID=33205 RepID=A0AAE8MHV1_9HYPO|nr:related to receptor-like protein kinase 5 precursor [Fusarium torulosum]